MKSSLDDNELGHFLRNATKGQPLSLDEVHQTPWYASLYLKRNDKTRQRDMHRLREMGLIFLDTESHLWPGFIRPKNVKPLGKKEV